MQKLLPVLFILISTMGAAQLPGNSVSFVGLNSHYVTVPDASSSIVNNTMTIEAWVYYKCENGTSAFNVFSKGWCGAPDWTIYVAINQQKLHLAKWRNGYNSCAGGQAHYYSDDEVIPFNTWTHIAISIDATTASNDIKFYVNGALVPHSLISGTDGAGWNTSTYPMLIGSSRSLANNYAKAYGNIDDLRI